VLEVEGKDKKGPDKEQIDLAKGINARAIAG